MKLGLDGVCEPYIRADAPKHRSLKELYMFSAANELDPGDVPDYLPKLSPIEEMCIVRAHCFVKVHQRRGV
jgi:hypothetical protein